ncbi:MAG: ribose-5-phosphate isomerase RpiA [Candidatus Bathyarchaeota archaeon]|nr:MAG: ribose-5-phosphate isomerase RpiA [Candidatus Bathyarchaeota archaeon]
MSWQEQAKKKAALEAVSLVKDGDIVGLGSGSTAAFSIEEIGDRIQKEKLKILGVPTSYQAFIHASAKAIPLTTLNEHPHLDIIIDGADQVDGALNLLKGRGGALTKEKIVASASQRRVYVVDETKIVNKLGTNQSVPVEVLPFAYPTIMLKISEMRGIPILREASKKAGPVITDNGNFVLDVDFGPIENPVELNCYLKTMPGVVETGIFAKIADIVYIGKRDLTIQRREQRPNKNT